MSNHTKRFQRDLESFGFRQDDSVLVAHDGVAYTHPNAPDKPIRVFPKTSDNAIATLTKTAKKIADLSSTGPDVSSIKDRVRVTNLKKKSKRQREDEARRQRAQKAESEYEQREAVSAAAKRRREIEDLMRPGYGR